MLEDFISKGISFRIIIINQDSGKREEYKANLNTNNDENNLQHLLEMAKIQN